MLLKKLISLLKPCTLYVRVRKNDFQIRQIQTGRELSRQSDEAFTTQRLLVGDYLPAERCLSQLLKELLGGSPRLAAPVIVMHPTEMVEGGLPPIEERVLLELAHGAGAYRACTWVGSDLSDGDVLQQARNL